MFNSRSKWVQTRQVAPLAQATEAAMQAMWFRYITQFGPIEKRWPSTWFQFGSENRDTVEQTSCYLAAQTLALDPAYAQRELPGNNTVAEVAAKWEAWEYKWLGERATHGFFIELASSSYWYRTW